MVKTLEDFEKNPTSFKEVRNWAEEIMGFIFSRSQENLVQLMPWGDKDISSRGRKPTKITDTSALLLSGTPPVWDGNTLSFEYTAPHAEDVEYGSDPKEVSVNVLAEWAMRKLRMKRGAAFGFARNLSKKIRKEGIPPHPYVRPALNEGVIKYKLDVKVPGF